MRLLIYSALILGWLLSGTGCGRQEPQILGEWSLDDLTGVIDRDEEISIDPHDSIDGGGSLYIIASKKRSVRLFEIGDLDIEDAAITFTASLKSRSVGGWVYLEMWVGTQDNREIFSRGEDTAISRSHDWATAQTVFLVENDLKVARIRLNVVTEGGGHVWVDDVKVTVGPLPKS